MSAEYDNTSVSGHARSLVSMGARPVSVEELPEPPAWMGDALCAQTDPDMFFPEKGGSTQSAKKVCGACDVREQCLAYALENDQPFGIWGGFSERERRKLKAGVAVVRESVRDRRRARIVALRGEGLTYAAIALRTGLSEGGVRRYLGVSE